MKWNFAHFHLLRILRQQSGWPSQGHFSRWWTCAGLLLRPAPRQSLGTPDRLLIAGSCESRSHPLATSLSQFERVATAPESFAGACREGREQPVCVRLPALPAACRTARPIGAAATDTLPTAILGKQPRTAHKTSSSDTTSAELRNREMRPLRSIPRCCCTRSRGTGSCLEGDLYTAPRGH